MENDRKLRSSDTQGSEQWARTGGEWFLRLLQELGVKYVFGTTGGGMPDIQDAFTAVKPPIWIQGLHEFDSLSAATGYALASEEASVCLIDRVVGTSNALGAFYAAFENYAPVIVFASQNLPGLTSGRLPDSGPRVPALHYHSWQSILPTPWTKWRHELSNLNLLSQSVMKAFIIANTEPQGPTYVTLRQDLMAAKVNQTSRHLKMSDFSMNVRVADEESVEAAVKLLIEAENPMILATNMGRNTSAVQKLVDLAEVLGCGVLDGRNFLNFPMDHPLFLGYSSTFGEIPYAKEADLFMCIETYYEYPFSPPEGCKVITIGPDPLMLQGGAGGDYGGTLYLPNVRLVGNSAIILSQLTSSIRRKTDLQLRQTAKERGARNKLRHENMLSEWSKEAKKHLNDDPVSVYRVAFEMNKLWDENTIWVNQTITMKQPLLHAIKLTKPGTYFSSPSGHLGPVAAMAYGVALARPNEKVIAMTGDGDFVFGNPASFLWTCSHYHIPVLYLVFNNACWGIEWPFIEDATLKLALSSNNYECVDIDEPRIDFAKLAKAFGIRAETLSHPEEAEEKLRFGFNMVSRGQTALIDVRLKKYTEGKSSYTYSFKRPIVNH